MGRILALDMRYGKRNPDLEKIQLAQDKASFKAGKVDGIVLYSTWLKEKIVDGKENGKIGDQFGKWGLK